MVPVAAAKQGYAKAQNHIGVRLFRGEGIVSGGGAEMAYSCRECRNQLARDNRRALAAQDRSPQTGRSRAKMETSVFSFALTLPLASRSHEPESAHRTMVIPLTGIIRKFY